MTNDLTRLSKTEQDVASGSLALCDDEASQFIVLAPDYREGFLPLPFSQLWPRVEEFLQIIDRSLPQ